MIKGRKIPLIIGIIVAMFLCGIAVIYSFSPKATLEIKNISVKEIETLNPFVLSNYSGNFEVYIGELEKRQESIKMIEVECLIKNVGIRQISIPYIRFSKGQELPEIVLGKRIDNSITYKRPISFLKETSETYKILVDASIYSDVEIVEQLKNVNVCVIDYDKPYTLYDDCEIISKSVPLTCN